MKITLYGAASENIDDVYKEKVGELGREMGRRGHTMVFGAGATGLMGAAARGIRAEGGGLIGVTPHFMHEFEPIFDDCTKLIDTETMSERKDQMEQLADAFVIVPGGIGTCDEFFQILTLKYLHRIEKPIVLFNVCNFWDNLLAVVGSDIFKGFNFKREARFITIVDDFHDVLSIVLAEDERLRIAFRRERECECACDLAVIRHDRFS